ncbi:MAG: hypothetical protein GIW97_01645 [Candidatus Eremiobacteraeota bacterium]|nr:hypothetical protein [Candidatus Eremiobacteraeota bacterium]
MRVAHVLCALAVLLLGAASHGGVAYKVVRPGVSATENGVRIIVRRIAISRHEIAITMTLQNLEPGFATFLPYNKSVLTDDRDNVYRSIETRDWRFTDKRFFLGVRLAGNAEYTGTMRFAAPPGSNARELHLEISPVLREDDRSIPFGVALPSIPVVL